MVWGARRKVSVHGTGYRLIGSPTCAYRFLGSSGQNVNDIFKYMVETSNDARLQAACNTLDWGHIVPTAPDTLGELGRGGASEMRS